MAAPGLKAEELNPLGHDDFQMIEEQLRQLAAAKALCERCQRCNLPVEQALADIDALEKYFHGIMQEFRGHNSPLPHPT